LRSFLLFYSPICFISSSFWRSIINIECC
jgi:hypothetical protein